MTGGKKSPGPLAGFLAEMAGIPWFESCGCELSPNESILAVSYVGALGIGEFPVQGVKDWRAAQTLAQDANWHRGWWEAESAAEKALHLQGVARFGRDDFLATLTDVAEAASAIALSATRALSRAGVADQGLAKAAAGAASQACHQAAMARLNDPSGSHLFARKFRLFAAGRWPLGIVQNRCFVF